MEKTLPNVLMFTSHEYEGSLRKFGNIKSKENYPKYAGGSLFA